MKSHQFIDLENQDAYLDQFMSLYENQPSVDEDQSIFRSKDISERSQILPQDSKQIMPSSEINTTLISDKSSQQRKQMANSSTAKYRQKKKKYVKQLEQTVRKLDLQLADTDKKIQETKDHILKQLESLIKHKFENSDNSDIFNQLELLIQQGDEEIPVDIDKVNLLIDTLKYRIGPTGRQRQAKLTYNFKNIVNTLFPALHRYLLITASSNVDIFKKQEEQGIDWTKKLFKELHLSDPQIKAINKFREKLQCAYQSALSDIQKLYNIKKILKERQIDIQNVQGELRKKLTAMQAAKWILNCEKNKYNRQVFLNFNKKISDSEDYVSNYLSALQSTQDKMSACRKLIKRQT